ncbi:MAG: hypothetical protein CR991_09330 [Proteobacteria bacterium]|nr:MAG: hypothetical protein CR991_09330 [Pseudomonadota bacterium]
MPFKFAVYATLLCSIVLGLSSLFGSAWAASPEVRNAMLKAVDTQASGAYVRDRFLKLLKKPFNPHDSRKKALIVGDSFAQDFTNVVLESGALDDYQLAVRYLPTRCQMYLGPEDISAFILPSDRQLCADADNLEQAKAQIKAADVVILVSNWKEWSAKRLPTTIKHLQLSPEQTLRVIGRKSFGRINVRHYLRESDAELAKARIPVDDYQTKINDLMKRTLSPSIFVDQHQLLCGGGETCPVFTPDLRLISFDGSHLTRDGAIYVGEKLFQHSLLKQL